jgi:hypothetical protein
MSNSWTLRAKADIAPGRASLPQDWFDQPGHEHATYVRVGSGKQALTLLAQPRTNASDREIYVAPGTLGLGASGTTQVPAAPLSVTDQKRQRAKEAVSGFGLLGLIVAVVGFAMEGFVNFNQHDAVYGGSNLAIALMSAVYPFMQIIGAILIFVKATFFASTP